MELREKKMIIETAIIATLLLAWFRAGKAKKGELTPERKAIFQAALEVVEDSGKLRELADVFASEGLTVQADLLRKRANLRELPPAVKEARHAAFLKAMNAADPRKVDEIADLFESEGAVGASNALRGYAAGLRAGTAAPYVAPPPIPTAPPSPVPHAAAPPPSAVTRPGAPAAVVAPSVPSAPSAPTGSSPASAIAATGAPAHEVASSSASTGQAVIPATSPSGALAQTPDNPSGLPVTSPPSAAPVARPGAHP
jgi:hypothetical protein